MAKKEEKLNYKELSKALAQNGPGRLYLLWGPEDYLRDRFLEELKKAVLPEGEDDFNYRRMEGASLDLQKLMENVDAMPFMAERTLTEIRGFDINKCRDAEQQRMEKIVGDLPDYCTLVFILDADYELDSRLKAAKSIKKYGEVIKFTSQDQSQLLPWIRRRFASMGKTIEPDAGPQLIYMSGDLMSGLIPEIEKIAASVEKDRVTKEDVTRYAHRLPEASVFDMTDCLANGDYDGAARLLAELQATGEPAIRTLAIIGQQFRRLYAARLAMEEKLGSSYVAELFGIKYDFIIRKLTDAARHFTLQGLARAVELCAEMDFRMKSSGEDDGELLRELLVRLAVERAA